MQRQSTPSWPPPGGPSNRDRSSRRSTACDRIAELLTDISPDKASPRSGARPKTLVDSARIDARRRRRDAARGISSSARESYVADYAARPGQGARSQGLSPVPRVVPVEVGLWEQALYHMRLDVSEQHEGNYLSSENRLTRIEARADA